MPNPNMEVLGALKNLEQEIRAGRIVAFAAVGIEADDNVRLWSVGPTKTGLQMLGAIGMLRDLSIEMKRKQR